MEREVFSKIQSQFGTSAKNKYGSIITFDYLEPFMRQFNNIAEDEHNTNDLMSGTKKLDKLNGILTGLGYGEIPLYDVYQACLNRQKNLVGLNQNTYRGTILATPATGTSTTIATSPSGTTAQIPAG